MKILQFCTWIVALVLVSSDLQLSVTGDGSNGIGVNYGLQSDNLPNPDEVIAKYREYHITSIRISTPDHGILQAIEDDSKQNPTDDCIHVYVGVPNEDLQDIASNPNSGINWVHTNMDPFPDICFDFVTVGNEAIPGPNSVFVAPAIRNMRAALDQTGYLGVDVSTVVGVHVLTPGPPQPTKVTFNPEFAGDMVDILKEIAIDTGDAPVLPYVQRLMINVFPYYVNFQNNSTDLLSFSMFTFPPPGPKDGELAYQNLFDAIVDGFYSAMEKVGFTTVGLTVSETGWPWAGNGNLTTHDFASIYNGILNTRVVKGLGTPKRPDYPIQAFIYAMFDENKKDGDAYQQYHGLLNKDMTPIYPLF